MSEFSSRTEMIIGKAAVKKLQNTTVAIFGLGGVGSYVAEALARCGVGKLILIDGDKVSESNINRQIIALNSTVGMYKTEVAKERLLDINKHLSIESHNLFYLPDSNISELFCCDYIVDAIDTISAKIDIIMKAKEKNIPIISAMGAGNKFNPTLFEVSDIYSTSVCPLCRVMRRELKKREVKNLKVVYSKEKPIEQLKENEKDKAVPGSISFVPSAMGLIIAYEAVKDIISNNET